MRWDVSEMKDEKRKTHTRAIKDSKIKKKKKYIYIRNIRVCVGLQQTTQRGSDSFRMALVFFGG